MHTLEGKAVLEKFVSVIVPAFSPERIILFGSRARGDHTAESDYDFLVIMKHLDNSSRLSVQLYREILPTDLPKNVDFLTISSARYEELKTKVGSIYKAIESEGILIYEQ
ncbi:MAG: nucleotidyltransferase domain-containing protein [Deltaproteobacteria bacterium]|jgi:predicted nucleotidyltransferase|nr:nucleotidyltransferase domain-containing protein [Deltaproteobacteria bacterium]